MVFKKISIWLIAVLLIFNAGCKRDKLTIAFNITDSFDFTFNSGGIINLPFDILTPDITTNSESEFEQNDTRADKIKEIKLNELRMSITSPDGKTFSFLKSLEVFISAEGLPEKLVAYAYDINSTASVLNLDCSNENLADYIKKANYKVRVKTVCRETTSQNVDVNCFVLFRVKAAPLK